MTDRVHPPTQHFFASTVIGWAVAQTRELAVEKAIGDLPDGNWRCWTCRVALPITAHYKIDNFTPRAEYDSVEAYRVDKKGRKFILHTER